MILSLLVGGTVLGKPRVNPPNFEIDLILVATPKPVAQFDKDAAWARDIVTGKSTSLATTGDMLEQLRAPRRAVIDAVQTGRPFFVFDGSGLKNNLYDSLSEKFATFFGVTKFFNSSTKKQEIDMLVLRTKVAYPDKYASNAFSNFYIDNKTRATGPRYSPGVSWPTFSVVDISSLQQLRSGPSTWPWTESSELQAEGYSNLSLNFSPLSASQTVKELESIEPNYRRICICGWGTQDSAMPNVLVSPPVGTAKTYRFGHRAGKWFAELRQVYR